MNPNSYRQSGNSMKAPQPKQKFFQKKKNPNRDYLKRKWDAQIKHENQFLKLSQMKSVF